MTLTELRDRLTAIIEDNSRLGYPERNENPVYLRLEGEKTPTGRDRPDTFFPIHFAWANPVSTGKVQAMILHSKRSEQGW